jgi:hypothetical protein
MASSLTWIDHDSSARERSLRLLALFQEKETRDELGMGSVRDSIAEQLFPGTSTIQTRLRYMMFVPWLYKRLEKDLEAKRFPTEEFSARAERMELELMIPLLESDDKAGIFGKMAGKRLKRLPSSVYWAGLGSWGIRRADMSRDQYHRSIAQVCKLRQNQTNLRVDRRNRGDDGEQAPDPASVTWHLKLPEPPEDFPKNADLALMRDEAAFIRDQLLARHSQSLLAHLAAHCSPASVGYPWEHPDSSTFSHDHLVILKHARMITISMHGAALLYNYMLSELCKREELVETYRNAYTTWTENLNQQEIAEWQMTALWTTVVRDGHNVPRQTRTFVEDWIAFVRDDPAGLIANNSARQLIQRRERRLKGGRSRFANHRALEQWGGASGVQPLNYRWGSAARLLDDLYAGLQRAS